jgi:hypothetical protein
MTRTQKEAVIDFRRYFEQPLQINWIQVLAYIDKVDQEATLTPELKRIVERYPTLSTTPYGVRMAMMMEADPELEAAFYAER